MSDETWKVLLSNAVEKAFEERVTLKDLMSQFGFEVAWGIDTHNKREQTDDPA